MDYPKTTTNKLNFLDKLTNTYHNFFATNQTELPEAEVLLLFQDQIDYAILHQQNFLVERTSGEQELLTPLKRNNDLLIANNRANNILEFIDLATVESIEFI